MTQQQPSWRRSAPMAAEASGAPARTDPRRVIGPSVGYAVVGLSAFVLLASGPRLLGGVEYSLLATSWTMITIFGWGLAYPAEQIVTTIVAGRGGGHELALIQVVILGLAAVGILLPLAAAAGHDPVLGNSTVWTIGVLAGAVGWASVVVPRGTLSGEGRFVAYGGLLVAEGVTRLALCALAWFVPRPEIALAAALVLPLLVSGLAGWLVAGVARSAGGPPQVRAYPAVALVALSFQVLMNAGPLVLQSRIPGDIAGQYVSAMTYMRIPMLFTSGFLTVVLSGASHAWAGKDGRGLDRAVRLAGVGSLACLVLTAATWLVSGPLLTAFYGSPVDLTAGVLALLGVASVLGVTANLLTQVPLGTRRQPAMAVIWVAAAGCALVLMFLASPTALGVTVATIVGMVLCIVPTWFVIRQVRVHMSGRG